MKGDRDMNTHRGVQGLTMSMIDHLCALVVPSRKAAA